MVLLNFIMLSIVSLMALPSPIQEEREKEEIRRDPRIKELLGDERFIVSEKTDNGFWVITDRCQLRVDIRYLPQNYCGPARFELVIHEPVCNYTARD